MSRRPSIPLARIAGCAILLAAAFLRIPLWSRLAQIAVVLLALVGLLWLAWKTSRRFLWRVGRRLAFSYFLIGVLPIPMALVLVALAGYLVAGSFLGHLYRDAAANLQHDLQVQAEAKLAHFVSGLGGIGPDADGGVIFGYYSDGRRVAGNPLTPVSWPEWMEASEPIDRPAELPVRFVLRPDGGVTLAATAEAGNRRVLALLSRPVEEELTRRSGVWVDLVTGEGSGRRSLVHVRIGGREFPLQSMLLDRLSPARQAFFATGVEGDGSGLPESFLDRPLLWWGEISDGLVSLEDGVPLSDDLTISLNGTLRTAWGHLVSRNAEIDTAAWAGLIAVTGLLSTLYGAAVVMALFMIIGLSRAVNRLSRATAAVRAGDFSIRIAGRRRDQVGELQRSFDEMAEHLEALVETAAESEVIEKELSIARDMQRSLLPTRLPEIAGLEFATVFEPSAAIGGDYYDILPLGEDCLAVIVADVSGHGLPTGLRMAMLKAALEILVDQQRPAEQMLQRLSSMIRRGHEQRYFVTATIGLLDTRDGVLDLTNAGHPPTYLLRNGGVEEIVLPSDPLGTLADRYARQRLELHDGDVVLWLSDGFIEAADPAGELFGYDGVLRTLEAGAQSAAAARDRLVEAVRKHTAGQPADDDMTLVAMGFSAGRSLNE